MYVIGHDARDCPFVLDEKARRLHLALIGATGTGKSTLLANLIVSDLYAGRGLSLIDPHGDLAALIADNIPPERMKDVIYFEPADPTHAVGFNPLSSAIEPDRLAANIVSTFKHIYRDSWGYRMEYVFGNALRLLLSVPDSSLLALPRLLVDSGYRQTFIDRCDDPAIRFYWEGEYARYDDRMRSEVISPIQNKVGPLVANPTIRAIFGQRNTLDIPAIMNGRKILIANLSKQIGEEPSHLIGAQLVSAIAQAAQARATMPEEKRVDFSLYVDEFQNFATDSFATILSEMRKWRLNLTLAHQFTGQLPDLLKQSLFGNVGTMIAFRVGADDAADVAKQLSFANPQGLTSTPNYHAWVTSVRGGGPHYISMLPLQKQGGGTLAAVKNSTRARYARKREVIERRLAPLFEIKPVVQQSKRRYGSRRRQ